MAVIEDGRRFVADVPAKLSFNSMENRAAKILDLEGVSSVQWTPVRTIVIEAFRPDNNGYEELKQTIKKILK